MTKDKDRDDALIAEVAEMFPPDTVDVQSRYVIVHQLRASADIQDAQTKRETGWADTSDRACLMRKAADALDALLAKLQPAPKPDRAKVLAQALWDQWTLKASEVIDAQSLINDAFNELRAEWEAERPAVVVPFGDDVIAAARFYADVPVAESRIVIMANAILDGAKGGAATSIDVHQRRGIMATCITLALRDYDEWQKDDDYNFIAALERVINHLEPAREVALQEFSQ